MDECTTTGGEGSDQAVTHLKTTLAEGTPWPKALLEAMSVWTAPEEIHDGTRLVYLISDEAFDWLTLACRLSSEALDAIPIKELEDLLFTGRLPDYVGEEEFKEALGTEKYSAYLNFFYGVEVELALQDTVEEEVAKRFYASGRQYPADHTDSAFQRIYRASREELLHRFRQDLERLPREVMTLTEMKEFTYWLFKRRLRVSDKAKVASDTRKGIAALDSAVQIPEEIGVLAS